MVLNKKKQAGGGFIYLLLCAALMAIVTVAAVGVSRSTSKPSAEIDKYQSSKAILANAILAINKAVSQDTDSNPLPPSGIDPNGDGYNIPLSTGARQTDAWGASIRYCPWDIGAKNSSPGRISGDIMPTAATPLFAIISAGPDKSFNTTCAGLRSGGAVGDDLWIIRALNDYRKDGVGNAWILAPVDCESNSAPTLDVNGSAAGCSTSSSRLDLIDTAGIKDGQQVAVRKSARVFSWQGGAWHLTGGVGPGSYPAPTSLALSDQSMQICGATLTSNAVQVNGIVAGTPISITNNGTYATSADGVTWNSFTSSVSTISPGSWIKLKATTPMADFGVTSVTVNIGGYEKIWNISNDVCKCNLPWGGTIDNGQTTAAFNSTSVPFGNLCSSEQRTCNLTTLGGNASYQYGSCYTVAGAACNLPWGGTVSHGNSTTAYATSTVSYTTGACSSETRSCWNGALSGSFTNSSCTVLPAAACNLPYGGSIVHGASAIAYQNSTEPYGGTCKQETRSCNDGSLSGAYTKSSCAVEVAYPCNSPFGGTIQPGSSIQAWNTTAAYGYNCLSETRTCSGPGNLSGSYTAASCQRYVLVSQGYNQYQCWNTDYVDTSGWVQRCSGETYVDTSHYEQQCTNGPWVDTSHYEYQCVVTGTCSCTWTCTGSSPFTWYNKIDGCTGGAWSQSSSCTPGTSGSCPPTNQVSCGNTWVSSGYYDGQTCGQVWVNSGYWDYSTQTCSWQYESSGYWNQSCGNVWVDTSYWTPG